MGNLKLDYSSCILLELNQFIVFPLIGKRSVMNSAEVIEFPAKFPDFMSIPLNNINWLDPITYPKINIQALFPLYIYVKENGIF